MKQNRTFSGTGKLIEKKESLCIAEIEVIFVESLPTTVFFWFAALCDYFKGLWLLLDFIGLL